MKYILHIDINSFFASVEELQNPDYRDKPLIVGGFTKRSVVSSANYLARSYGVKAAMPIYMAQKLCKKLLIATPHFHLYREYSQRFFNLIAEHFTNRIEVYSIDECFVDITKLVKKQNDTLNIAKAIQQKIKQKLHLNCSIGISYNKFLAKIASDFKKPLGISTLFNNEIVTKLWPLSIEHMIGIGKATAQKLKNEGFHKIKDIALKDNNRALQKILGQNWIVHYHHANGIGDDEIDLSQNAPKSIGSSETFLIDTNDEKEIYLKLNELTKNVVKQLKDNELLTKTISINIKTPSFKTYSKSLTLRTYIDNFQNIFDIVIHLYGQYFANQNVRLVGVSLSHLKDNNQKITSDLFDEKEEKHEMKKTTMHDLIKKLNEKFDKNIIDFANEKLIS